MPPKHRAERGSPRDQPATTAGEAVRPRRWRRRLAWLAAALISSAVVLGAVVWVGCESGANACPGKKFEAGATGAEIFARNCASCHGLQGQGDRGPAFAAGGPLSALSFDERVEKTGRGKPLNAMPRWRGKLTPDEIRMVAAYTQVLSGLPPEPSVGGVQ
ncbi:MAG: c-type cytochrome [Mycobacteriales bacterium]